MNKNSDLHSRGLIANSPDEVGTIIFVETMLDQSKQYQDLNSYSSFKFRIFIVDAASKQIVARKELKVDKFNPPSSIKGLTKIYPYDKLDAFIASL